MKAFVNIASVIVLRSMLNPLLRGWTRTDLYDEMVAGARLQSSKRYLRNEKTTSRDMVDGRVLLRKEVHFSQTAEYWAWDDFFK